MAVFTKEQMDVLYEAEIHFESVRHGYIKSVPRWLTDQVADIYEQATGSKVNRNWSCSQCVANLYMMVGKIYFKDKEEYKNKEKEKDMTQIEYTTGGSTISNVYVGETETEENETEEPNKNTEIVEQPIKKGRGRPKKQNTEE